MTLELIALAIAGYHFAIPILYYSSMKIRYLKKDWNMNSNGDGSIRISIIIPTYMEADLIARKLDQIYSQQYPKELIQLIVVDGNSGDGTAQIVEKWASEHHDIELELMVEESRKGKAHALNEGLRKANGEIVIAADADAIWPTHALSEVSKWFEDKTVGAVSCLKRPTNSGPSGIEQSYRSFYNELRIAESKAYATPIFHGELAAFRRDLLLDLGGFPCEIGADDSHSATKITMAGFRAIIPEELMVEELVPDGDDFHRWRIRRAQHLVQHFLKSLSLRGSVPKIFSAILSIEAYLHLLNPWLLIFSIALLLISAISGSLASMIALSLGAALLALKPFRAWVMTQLYLTVAAIRNFYSREIIWRKEGKL